VSTARRCHCSASDEPPLIAYTDLDRLKHRLKELSPADAGVIGELIEITNAHLIVTRCR